MPTLGLNGNSVNTSPYTTGTCVSGTSGGPYVAPVVSSTQSFVRISDVNILIESNTVPTHTLYANNCSVIGVHSAPEGSPPPPPTPPPISFNAAQGFVTINGTPILMNGDPANCSASHTLTATGPAWITITP
jgi:uncharacterized Zn-binding protein involved in type VI secretion